VSDWYFAPDTLEDAKTGHNRSDAAPLSANQEKALAALIACGTVVAAASKCGLGERTIRRYLQEENFARAYRAARDKIIEGTVAYAGSLATEALEVHAEVMRDANEESRVRLQASRSILDVHLKSIEAERKIRETEELEARIAALEAASWTDDGK